MYKDKTEVFFNPDTKQKWLTALRDKITETEENLNETEKKEPEAVKRLETKLQLLSNYPR